MAGNITGGKKTASKLLKENPNYYKIIGSKGGKNGTGHAFAHGKIDPSVAGKRGGELSKRTAKIATETVSEEPKARFLLWKRFVG